MNESTLSAALKVPNDIPMKFKVKRNLAICKWDKSKSQTEVQTCQKIL